MAIETISALTALIIAVSVVLTAVFNAKKGTEEILSKQIEILNKRLEQKDTEIKELRAESDAKDLRIDELEKRVNVLSNELQKITNPKIRTRNRNK